MTPRADAAASSRARTSGDTSPGLTTRGIGVYDALRYFVFEGRPSRMDVDGNGIPCETVYPNAADVWFSGF